LVSHGIRKDTTLHLFFNEDGIDLMFIGSQVRQLRPDEQSTKGILRKAKLKLERGIKGKFSKIHTGILMSRTTLSKLMSTSVKGHSSLLKLKNEFKRGLDIRLIDFDKYTSFIFIVPLMPLDEQLLKDVNGDILNIKLSRERLNAPQLIVLFHNEVDRHVFKQSRH